MTDESSTAETTEESDDTDAHASTGDATLGTTAATSTPSTYKVRGRLPDTDAAGVLGQSTANSGRTYGVRGETTSSGSDSAGVHGEAKSTTGNVHGVRGVTKSNGSLLDVIGGVRGDAPSNDSSVAWGVAGASNAEGFSDKVLGAVYGGGVIGEVDPTSGSYTAGVFGKNLGSHDGAAGTFGNAAGGNGEIYGVKGQANSQDTGTAGVYGEAVEASGEIYGVRGETNSQDTGTAGVFGETLKATGRTYGVRGKTNSKDNGTAGLYGEAVEASGEIYGVKGKTESTQNNTAGVYGDATGTSGEIYGVRGEVVSPSGYGLYTPDDLKVGGVIDRDIGAKVAMSSDQTITDSTKTKVAFDDTSPAGFVDDRGEFDAANNRFVCATPGTYRVTVNIEWADTFTGDQNGSKVVIISVEQDNNPKIFGKTVIAADGSYRHNVTGTLRDLSGGEYITIHINQTTGSSKDINSINNGTNLSIEFLGQ